VSKDGKPLNVKGVCASAATGRLYVSTIESLMCLDLATSEMLWEKQPEGGCDRMAISPDGKLLFTPSLEGPHWNVIDASSGDVVQKVVVNSGAHNTVCGLDGKFAYFAGLKSPVLRVFDVQKREVLREVGPFGNVIRPFTVNGAGTLCFVNVNELLGFEVGDLTSGKVLHRVEVEGFKTGETKRHGCPSHGVALTPDEKELWLTDAANSRLHVFDATVMPPKQMQSIELTDQPGWVTFGLDGKYAYPSTGDVIDSKSKKIVAVLRDEHEMRVQSEKLLEIDFGADGKCVKAGDQFGIGRVAAAESVGAGK
jgi:DNA-binding beta-propeller fold protein YncE